jgi:membrane-bound serine protease (ClpP class)
MKMFAISICVACGLGVAAAAPARETIHKGDVVVVPVHGEVAPSLLAFLRRAVKTAESNDASAIVFDMNTYGGRLDTATDIINALNQIKIPTYTFINTNAGSAGALIVIATRHIYMAPVSAIGAGRPDSFNGRRSARHGKGKNDFVLVCARPRLGHQERP